MSLDTTFMDIFTRDSFMTDKEYIADLKERIAECEYEVRKSKALLNTAEIEIKGLRTYITEDLEIMLSLDRANDQVMALMSDASKAKVTITKLHITRPGFAAQSGRASV